MGFRTSPEKQVKYSSLDIADKSSIESLVDTIKKEHKTVDVLVNNAGVYFEDKYNPQNVKTTFDVNVRGTLQVRASINLFSSQHLSYVKVKKISACILLEYSVRYKIEILPCHSYVHN